MKILYVCGTYYPATGGAEISAHTLLKELVKTSDTQAFVLTDEKYIADHENITLEGVIIYGTSHQKREDNLRNLIKKINPDVIYTQLMWSDIALKIAKENNIPSVLRSCKIPFELNICENSIYSPTQIICVSESVKKYIEENYNRTAVVIHPPIDLNSLKKEYKPESNDLIIMFNPIKRKGGQQFRELAKSFSNQKFGVVLGWSSLKQTLEAKDFSGELIQRITESLGSKYEGNLPEYIDMCDLQNVEYLTPTKDVWKIYCRAKIIIIPSQWEEAFGRVALEAMSLGIPVIASKVGGLQEAVEYGGFLVTNYKDAEAWKDALKQFLDPQVCDDFSNKAIRKSKEYVLEENINQHKLVLKKAINYD